MSKLRSLCLFLWEKAYGIAKLTKAARPAVCELEELEEGIERKDGVGRP